MLVDVLNDLGAPGAAPGEFAAAVRSLDAAERREAVALHLAALLEALPQATDGDALDFGGVSVSFDEREGARDIRYDDIEIGYVVKGARLARQDGPSTLAGLIELLVYARERSDVLLYLPQDERLQRIADLSDRVGASERFIRFVLARAPALERAIAA